MFLSSFSFKLFLLCFLAFKFLFLNIFSCCFLGFLGIQPKQKNFALASLESFELQAGVSKEGDNFFVSVWHV
jgi:hypothetical protein